MEKVKLIENILETARISAAALVSAAEAERDEALEKTRAELEYKASQALDKAGSDARLLIERRVSVANLERGKTLLKARRRVLDNVYGQAAAKILNMTDNIYRDFIGGILLSYAENNDRVVICERDSKRLTADWVKKIADEKKISLTLSGEYHTGRGGVILSGAKYDKNLTLETLIADLKEKTEVKTAKMLFSE